MSPTTLLVYGTIKNKESKQLFRVLMDSGATHTMMHEICLPPGANPSLISNGTKQINTIAGLMQTSRKLNLQDMVPPEFDKSRKIDGINAYVFNSDCHHGDALQKIGFIINFAESKIVWFDQEVEMKPPHYWEEPMSYHVALDDDNEFESYAARILDAKYVHRNIYQ